MATEATCYSETSVNFYRTKQRYIRDDRNLHNHRCDNLRSDKDKAVPVFSYLEYLSILKTF
jgi:hypothetical protein